MRNTFLLGSRRSGAGLLSAALAKSGFQLPAGEMRVDRAHPFGAHDSTAVTSLNDELILPHMDALEHYAFDHRWLATPERCAESPMPKALRNRAARLLAKEPFCIHDTRLAFTLPAWRELAPDAAFVCVYRHPANAVERMVSAYGIAPDAALRHWMSTYRSILRHQEAGRGDWLFIDFDELLSEAGRARVEGFLEAKIEDGEVDDAMRETRLTGIEVSADALQLFEELAKRSGSRPVASKTPPPSVDAIALIGDHQRDRVPELVEDVASQRSVRTTLVLIDATSDGGLNVPTESGALVVRDRSHARGRSYRSALAPAVCDAPYIALLQPGCRLLPTHLARAARSLERGADLVTCDYFLSERERSFVDRASPRAMGHSPGPFWEGGLVLRRDVLASASPIAHALVEHRLWAEAKERGKADHLVQPGFHVNKDAYERAFARSRELAASAHFQGLPAAPLALSVSLAASPQTTEAELRATLESLALQHVAPGTFEVLVASASTTVDLAALREERFPFEIRFLGREPLTGSREVSALHDTSLELARGERVLFLVAGDRAAPDLIEQHLGGPSDTPGLHATVGQQALPDPERDDPLSRHLRARAEAEPGSTGSPISLSFSNTSVPLDALLAVGGFDESLERHSDLDLGLRLEQAGCPVLFDPRARVSTSHRSAIADLRRSCRALGAGSVLRARQDERKIETPARRSPSNRQAILEDALDELASIDIAAFENMEGDYSELAARLFAHTAEVLAELESLWIDQGMRDEIEAGESASGTCGRTSLRAAFEERERWIQPGTPLDEGRAIELSVIVPTHERSRELANLIENLAQQDLDPRRFEVLVVDDGSSTPASTLDLRAPNLILLRQEGGGPGKARNLAARRARGRYLVFLNDDAVPAPDLLRLHLERQRSLREPEAILGTFTLLPEHQRHSIGRYVETTNSLFAQPTMKPGVLYHGLSFCSGNISLPKSSFEAVGGFDESLPYAGGEDTELGLRLEEELGLRVRFDPTLRCRHDHALDVTSILRRKRVLGWVLHRIQTKHGDRGLLPLPAWPPHPTQWTALANDLERKQADATRLEREAQSICQAEVREGTGPTSLAQLLPVMRELETFALLCGALDAHLGRDPARRSGAETIGVASVDTARGEVCA